MRTWFGSYIVLMASLIVNASVHALETDQFYAWGKPIDDSTEYINAWVQLTVQSALDSKAGHGFQDCEAAAQRVQRDLQHSIYQPIELWILSTDLVDKIPRGTEANRDYRSNYLLSKTYPFDTARGLQPSPTVQVNDIRFGSDKLAHFFSQGWWYYRYWKKNRDDHTAEELQRSMFKLGVNLEHSIQGMTLTGVFSPGDLEANYQGFVFYHQLCHGEEPLISRQDSGWQFSGSFDVRDYVYPKWDESWNPNVYSKRRWEGVSSTMSGYCSLLSSDWVSRQRALYAKLDTLTPTDQMIQELVVAGELPDPAGFDITSVCK